MFFRSKPVAFTDLPQDILLEIYSHLSPETALHVGSINKQSYAAIHDNFFWQKKFALHFPDCYEELKLEADIIWQKKFQATYFSEYKNLSPQQRKLFSLVKEGDSNALQKIVIPYLNCISIVDNRNMSLLSYAQSMGQQAILDYFYQLGLRQPGIEKIQWAIACHQLSAQIILWHELFNHSQAQANYIHLAAIAGNVALVEELLEKRPSLLEEKDSKGYTPLLLAAQHGHTQLVRHLLAHGADIHAEYAPTQTALTLAIHKGYNQIVTLLLQGGAQSSTACCPIHLAAFLGNLFVVKQLLALYPELLEIPNELGHTPLIGATWAGNVAMVEYLLSVGANVNAHSKSDLYRTHYSDKTALCVAINRGNLPLVDLLLAAGAQTTLKATNIDFQPIHLAISSRNLEIVQKLIEHSPALCTIKNSAGLIPLQLATSYFQKAISSYLLKVTAKNEVLAKLPDFQTTTNKQASKQVTEQHTQPDLYFDLENYIHCKKSHFLRSPITFFGTIANTLSTRRKKLAAAEALKAVITKQKDLAELNKHSKQFKGGQLGDIYHRLRKL